MKSGSSWTTKAFVLAAATLFLAFAVSTSAQVKTETTTTAGTPTKEATVERGEVVMVDGNDLIVKMEDGTIRHFPNIPESARITVEGKSLGIHDLKPGMKLQRTITTTTTPQTVTTVQSVTGTVWNVMPPNSVTLTMENGKNQTFKIPKGQKFNVDGQMVDAFGLKKGMKVTATKVVEAPETVVSQQRKVTGTMPPPPPAPPADVPILIAKAAPTPTPAEAPAAAPAKLPKTGSKLPLVGLLGLLCVSASLGLKLIRSIAG
jgi:RNase P/RNase MRP subunit p29